MMLYYHFLDALSLTQTRKPESMNYLWAFFHPRLNQLKLNDPSFNNFLNRVRKGLLMAPSIVHHSKCIKYRHKKNAHLKRSTAEAKDQGIAQFLVS